MTDPAPVSVWIRSAVMPDGSYGAEVSIGEDVSWALGPGGALRYAAGILAAVAQGEHDRKLLGALRAIGMDDELIGSLIFDVRKDRDAEVDKRTRPLALRPGVSLFTGEVFLAVRHDDPRVEGWQWSPAEARQHALGVLEVVAVGTEDNRLHRLLTADYGLDSNRARAVLDAMSRQ